MTRWLHRLVTPTLPRLDNPRDFGNADIPTSEFTVLTLSLSEVVNNKLAPAWFRNDQIPFCGRDSSIFNADGSVIPDSAMPTLQMGLVATATTALSF